MLRKIRDLFIAYNKCAIEDALRRSQWGLGWPGLCVFAMGTAENT
jgi:hypothetical protein